MQPKFCSCSHCKRGLHHSKRSKAIYKRTKRKARQMTRIMLKKGEWENLPNTIGVPYTD